MTVIVGISGRTIPYVRGDLFSRRLFSLFDIADEVIEEVLLGRKFIYLSTEVREYVFLFFLSYSKADFPALARIMKLMTEPRHLNDAEEHVYVEIAFLFL